MEKLVSLSKRRGFIFPGSEVYSGLGGIYDLGPLGVELANNIKKEWWENIVQQRDNVVGLDSSILMNSEVWKASGHVEGFTDPLVECKNCHTRFRPIMNVSPHFKARGGRAENKCPNCGSKDLTEEKQFNLMFKTHIGPVAEEGSETYLRPETAQGIFVNFKNVVDTMRVKLPFGIAQIGKGFRNEITTGNFLFRVREFEMMELEFFVKPGEDEKWHEYWKKERMGWFLNLGIKKENIKFVDLPKEDLAHYSKATSEIWYKWPFMDWGELEGIANRTDYDLKKHTEKSGKEQSIFDEEEKKQITPYVIEPSVGVGRAMLAFLLDAYTEEKAPTAESHSAEASRDKEETRVVLKLDPRLAPVKAAILPLVKDEKLKKIAVGIYDTLKSEYNVVYDEVATIGRRYRRQDEIGTPYCVTVDFDSLKDNSITIRDRDSMKQKRVSAKELGSVLREALT